MIQFLAWVFLSIGLVAFAVIVVANGSLTAPFQHLRFKSLFITPLLISAALFVARWLS